MYLKSLTLAGFKSFADRTRLHLEAGVNVVVGPNGSGKSNLVDAVAWVLGTQATSTLRTQKMEDVIFSGTATRPPLGRAEVSLTIDNDSGALPLDLPEVAITRRLFRDGTSEYEINGVQCRLLDVQELLSDGGVGRHQHVIVGQGRIGEILTARPEEHRAVVEEAAGVTKHRRRRDRALRRLEQTEVDVARLQDILTEQERRMRPLRRQARAAERHGQVKAELRAMRLWLGGRDLRALRDRRAAAVQEQSELAARLAATEQELAALTGSLGEMEEAAGLAGRALERDTAAAARLETTAERLQRVALVARERRIALESRLMGAGERRRDLEDEQRRLAAALEAAVADEAAAERAAAAAEVRLRALEDEERSLSEQAQLPAEGVVATLRGDLRALEAAAERDHVETEAVADRLKVVIARLEDESRQAEQLVGEQRATDAQVSVAQQEYRVAEQRRRDDQQVLERAEQAAATAGLELAGARARVEALEAVVAGLADPELRDRVAASDGIAGSVAARLDVPPELTGAVDAALGAWSDGFVASDAPALTAVVSGLKADGSGGVPVVVARAADVPAREVATRWGADALADRLGPAADPDLAGALLGDVVLVEGWSAAWQIAASHPELRVVTPEGDLVTGFGVRAGVPDGAGPVALEEAQGRLEAAETAEARADSLLAQARRAFDRSRRDERAALEALEGLEARLAGSTEALAMIERAAAEGEAERDRLEERRDALAAGAADRRERLADLRRRLGEFEGEEAERQQAWEQLQARRDEVARRRDESRAARHEAAAALAAVAERRRITAARLDRIAHELAETGGEDADPAEGERLVGVETRARAALDVVRRHVEVLRERQRAERVEAGEAGAALEAARRRRRELEESLFADREQAGDTKVELAELAMREEAVAERLRRDADATEDEALAAPQPDVPEGATHEDHLASLEATLRRLGPVNPLAAAEYQELAERAEFLRGQLADLESARADLRKVIKALDGQIAGLFQEALADIDTAYQENFALLFPGGKGRLRLTDPDDPLNCGVELEAQPLGKKISRLSLLSGGERSLAALAFLFAVFRARPSPFYILDEVEAALDDANLHRFLRLVGTLRGAAQLTVVTHQQQTMEVADILYGVTMEPGESSRVLAKRLSQATV